MATSTHTHEELATKRDVDARFDRVEARLERIEDTLVHLTSSMASILNILTSPTARVEASEENQRTMLQILERIENSTNRQIGF